MHNVQMQAFDQVLLISNLMRLRLTCPSAAGGKLVTLFSAPCYPMFSAAGEEPFHNKAAIVHLSAPEYAEPEVLIFEAVLPRPQVWH